MDEEKKDKIVQLIREAAEPVPPGAEPEKPPKKRTSHKKSEPTGNTVNVNGDGHTIGQIVGGDSHTHTHNHINEKKVVRPNVVRGPEFISSAAARKIQNRVKTLVERDVAAGELGGDTQKLYAKWYGKLKNFFEVPSYLEIPADREQQAIDWLQKQKVSQRPKIRRTSNDTWRNDHYTGIWARAKALGMSKADVYALVLDRLGKNVISLKKLGERDLKKLYVIIFNMKLPAQG
jgi:hypothetical protein